MTPSKPMLRVKAKPQSAGSYTRQMTAAWSEIGKQLSGVAPWVIPQALLTPDGLRKIVAMISRSNVLENRKLELLLAWVAEYRKGR